ncbi:MAG: hypothetical protein WCI55_10165 [Armatimonadota bacterium]
MFKKTSNVSKGMIEITQKDKTLAAGINVAAIFFPYMGPIVGTIIGSKSPYAKFHAYRNLIQQIVSTIIIGILMACSLAYSIYSLYNNQKDGFDLSKIEWLPILLKAAITWALLALWGVINAILSIRDALQALRGQLPTKPKWTERKAMKLSGLPSTISSNQSLQTPPKTLS